MTVRAGIIPIRLSLDLFEVGIAGEAADALGGECIPGAAEGIDDGIACPQAHPRSPACGLQQRDPFSRRASCRSSAAGRSVRTAKPFAPIASSPGGLDTIRINPPPRVASTHVQVSRKAGRYHSASMSPSVQPLPQWLAPLPTLTPDRASRSGSGCRLSKERDWPTQQPHPRAPRFGPFSATSARPGGRYPAPSTAATRFSGRALP